ncbi:MAG: DUF262 domain-containing protein [Spirulina sp. SIO3F2]|nr:DUF262 domain-containing protein [Spirulina sp. SIO3F2]
MSMEDLAIRQILNKVSNGQLRVPAFQRGFVWDASKVAYLMDSLYKGYPIGSLLIWRTGERLKFERKLGPFKLPELEEDYPVDYILDGQQRITSIFGVFQTDLHPDGDDSWTNIYFDLSANNDVQESQIIALSPGDISPEIHFPLGVLFDTVGYRKATRELSDEAAEKIDVIQAIFKESQIPIQQIETDDRTTVAIVFERVNQRGVPLDTLQLLTAWTWSEEFDLHQKFNEINEELETFGFNEIDQNNNLLLRICSAVLAHDASVDTLISLNGSNVRERFREVSNGLKGAIDFLQSNLNVFSLENLPYPALLIPLSVFFAVPGNQQVNYSDEQRKQILQWFWRSCFSRRYNSQPTKTIRRDIKDIVHLREGHKSPLGSFAFVPVTPDFFSNQVFRMNNVNSKSFVLLLAQSRPKSFVSGNNVSLQEVLSEYNRKEFHHLYPRAYLRTVENEINYDMNCLANFCFISRSDNNALGGESPSRYRSKMPSDIAQILKHSMCPQSLFLDNFNSFILERSKVLAKAALEICL